MINKLKKIFAIFIFIFSSAFSKDIYVGDQISLNIKNINENELKESFKDYHVDNIQKTKNGYNIFFRTFKVGDNIINIGNEKITIKVKSTLDKNDKKIHMDFSDKSNKDVKNIKFPFLTLLSGIFGFSFIIFSIYKLLKRKKIKKQISNEEIFKEEMKNLSPNKFHFEISLALRKYIDRKYASNFLAGEYTKIGKIEESDIAFIKTLDYYKFSGKKIEEINYYKEKAFEIYKRINMEGDNIDV